MALQILDEPQEEWAEEHRWKRGDEFKLLVPRDDSSRVMMLPVWGWSEVIYRYRLTQIPADTDPIVHMDADVFEGPGGRVLVVHHYDGFEDRVAGDCGDYSQDRGARVWEAPARVAKPPRHLVDVGSRHDVNDWLVESVAPVATSWATTLDLSAKGMLDKASLVDPEELSDWLVEAAARFYDDATFGWSERDITVGKKPRAIVHYPAGRHRVGTVATWGFAYDGCVAEQDFLLVLFFEKSQGGNLQEQAQIIWGDQVERAVSAGGEDEGVLWLIGLQFFDWHAPTLQTSIPF